MSASVLLFADFGNGPRSFGNVGDDGPACGTSRQHRAWRTARRWWLVECENAEHGRDLIDAAMCGDSRDERGHKISAADRLKTGRILASGASDKETGCGCCDCADPVGMTQRLESLRDRYAAACIADERSKVANMTEAEIRYQLAWTDAIKDEFSRTCDQLVAAMEDR